MLDTFIRDLAVRAAAMHREKRAYYPGGVVMPGMMGGYGMGMPGMGGYSIPGMMRPMGVGGYPLGQPGVTMPGMLPGWGAGTMPHGVGAVVASPSEQTVNVTATVASTLTNGTVNAGAVAFTIYNSSNVKVGSSVVANVSGGTASASLTLPGETPAGSYTVQASYTDSGGLVAAPATTTLSIQLAATSLSVGSLPALTANSSNQLVSVSALVGSPNAAINQGAVTFTLVNGNNVPVGSAVQGSVLNGTANALLTVPGGLPAGNYFVRAAYSDNQGVFAGSISDSSLTLNSPSPSPIQAALTVAIDTAALLLLNDTAAYQYLAGISQSFLGQPLPSPTQLIPDLLSELTYAGELDLIGLQAGINYANNIIGGT